MYSIRQEAIMNRIGNFFRSFLPFILYVVIQLAVMIVMMVVYGIYHFATNPDATGIFSYLMGLSTDQSFLQMVSIVFSLITIFIFSFWYKHVFVRPLRSRPKKYWTGISVQIIFALVFLAFGLQYVAQLLTGIVAMLRPEWMAAYQDIMNRAGYSSVSILLAIYTIILAPVAEELAFRGLTYRFARKAFPFWGANILQALLFGVIHMNMIQGIYAFALGLFLGWVCRTGHSIKYSILLHIFFNILGCLFSGFFEFTTALNDYAFYAAGVALTVFALIIFSREFAQRNRQMRRQREYEEMEES